MLGFGNESLFLPAQPPDAVAEHLAEEDQRRADADECQEHGKQLRRTVTAISGSRPTIIVSLWWRAWLQRQRVAFLTPMKEAIS